MPDPAALTTAEAADLTGLPAQRIRLWIRDGRVKAERRGHLLMVDRESLLRVAADPPRRGNPTMGTPDAPKPKRRKRTP